MKLTFLGAAREVTGSCYLIETGTARFMVDCGMFQGGREAPARNRRPFSLDPGTLDFVLLTHAHIDHSGLLPKLVNEGFGGPIHATRATADLLGVMLPDSGHIQEVAAERALRNQKTSKRGGVATMPLYTVQDAMDCLHQLSPLDYDQWLAPHPGIRCRFHDAGHILGSAIIEIQVTEGSKTTTLVFSGDLGQPGRPILRDPSVIEAADVLFIESTYGDRLHKDLPATLEELAQVVERTLSPKRGNVIIPAFAVGRTQEIIYSLHQLTRQGRLRDLNIFVDSPMATAATRITMQHLALFDDEARRLADWRATGHSLPQLKFVGSVDESMALNRIRSGAIIISASGMCDAGRIKHHLRHNLGRRDSSILIVGFQAAGTLGRRIVDGAKNVRIFGIPVPVRADIYTIGGLSAHADQDALLGWLSHFKRAPRHTFVVHGEQSTAEIFAAAIHDKLGWSGIAVPALHSSVTL